MDLTGVCPMTEEQPVGCRRGLLQRTIGRMRFAVPGSFLYDLQTQETPSAIMMRAMETAGITTSARSRPRGTQIRPEPFERETVLRTEEFAAGGVTGSLRSTSRQIGRCREKPAVTNAVLVGESLAFRRGNPRRIRGLRRASPTLWRPRSRTGTS